MLLISQRASAFVNAENNYSFCFEEWTPYAYLNEQGQAAGESIDLLQQRLLPTGIHAVFKQFPYQRCIELAKNKKIDFVLYVDASDGLELMTPAIADWELTFAVRQDSSFSMAEIANSIGLKVLVARDYTYPDKLLAKMAHWPLNISKASFETENAQQVKRLFSILTSGRVDAILIDKVWADLMIATYKLPVKLLKEAVHVEPQFIGYHKDNQAKAEVVSALLQQH